MPFGNTQRLWHIQSPASGEKLARSLFLQVVEAPSGAYWIGQASELSSQLQKIVRNLRQQSASWTAYSTRVSSHLFTAEVEFDLSRDRGKPVLRVREYNEGGRVTRSDLWVKLADDQWMRCSP
jgi:hypothetical protein